MDKSLKTGGRKPTDTTSDFLLSLKLDTSKEPRMLTPSEQDSLRRHSKQVSNTLRVKYSIEGAADRLKEKVAIASKKRGSSIILTLYSIKLPQQYSEHPAP